MISKLKSAISSYLINPTYSRIGPSASIDSCSVSDFCIEAKLNKEEITKIVKEVSLNLKETNASTTALIDYLAYWNTPIKGRP